MTTDLGQEIRMGPLLKPPLVRSFFPSRSDSDCGGVLLGLERARVFLWDETGGGG